MNTPTYKPGDRVWYFVPFKLPTSKRVTVKDPLTGKGRYVQKSFPPTGGSWSPGGLVLEVLTDSAKVEVTGDWDKEACRFKQEVRVLPFSYMKPSTL